VNSAPVEREAEESMESAIEFRSTEEAVECMLWWKRRLYLDDWIIKILLVPRHEIEGYSGQNHFMHENRCAVIHIAIPDDDMRSRIIKQCHEKTLVHELLHCKYNWMQDDGSYEGKYLDICEHALLEQMARSLIMAKYGVPPEWFSNV
jgi:hypothetical protein